MNQETLERLLVDQALGALSADVNSLLDAYASEVPARQDLQKDIRSTVQLAGAVLHRSARIQLPPLKIQPLTAERTVGRRRSWWPMQLAAVFVVGLALGLQFRNSLAPRAPRKEPMASLVALAPAASAPAPAGFWSIARFAAMQQPGPETSRAEFTWTSPVRKPLLNP